MDFAGLEVMLVEDNPILLRSLARTFRSLGFVQLELFASADEAKDRIEAGSAPDLVFSDVRMPGEIDGFGLAQWVEANRPSIHVMLQTGYSEVQLDRFIVLEKPFGREELQRALSAVFND